MPHSDKPSDRPADTNHDIELARALEAWEADSPPAGFADKVLASARAERNTAAPAVAEHPPSMPRLRTRQGQSQPRRLAAIALLAACVFALVIGLRGAGRVPEAIGQIRVATARISQPLGHRGVAVAEPGAVLSWRISSNGAAAIEQSAGEVFYRVDRGGTFTVRTPAGDVSVQGTCFRVEVDSMKPGKQAWMGAALGAALVVTVYEGRVLVASGSSARAAGPGETMVVRAPGDAPRPAGDFRISSGTGPALPGPAEHTAANIDLAPPSADITREALLARDASQRQAIAKLRAELVAAHQGAKAIALESGSRNRAVGPDGRPWFDPSTEVLRQYAEQCRVDYDVPPISGMQPMEISPAMAERRKLSEDERVAINSILADMHARWTTAVRALYAEATGDTSGAESLSAEAMARELVEKSMPGEFQRVQQRIAWERAGMVEPTTDLSQASPLERYYRLLGTLGTEMEQALSQTLGAERARALREQNDGWGMHQSFSGCPDATE